MDTELVIWRCPDCEREIEQALFGTQHTASIACIDCETTMETISTEESSYDYTDVDSTE